MKNFIEELKVKKVETSELAGMIDDNQTQLVEFYVKHGHKMKNQETINTLYNKMLHPKFVKALKKVAKSVTGDDKSWAGLDVGFIVLINGFIENMHKNEAMTEELMSEYTKIINKVLKPRINEISKEVGIEKDIVKELLVIVPDKETITNDRAMAFYCQKMLRKMYILAAEKDLGLDKIKRVKNLFQRIFGKKCLDLVAINILLEKKEYMKNFNENQTTLWNMLTEFALGYINDQDKGHITELIEYYTERRKGDAERNRDSARRISLANIDEEKYPVFAKRAKKFAKDGDDDLTNFM